MTNRATQEKMTEEVTALLPVIQKLHERIRAALMDAGRDAEAKQSSALADVSAEEEGGDTIYAIDKISEELLLKFFAHEIDQTGPIVLLAEGLPSGKVVLPNGCAEEDAKWRVLMDPIDGTRGLMYGKRSAWILTGIAPNLGPETNLQDIVLAVQTELPTVKQTRGDMLWAIRGQGASAERHDLLTNERVPLPLRPSQAETLAHGYASVARFFPGAREELAAIDEEIVFAALGPVQPGKAHCFEDQYASSGGQLYELMRGADRFIADLRPLMPPRHGQALGLCCHPYDLCTALIARELGVIVTDPFGRPVQALLAVEPDVAWVGYANAAIQAQIEPLLQAALQKRGLN